MAVPPTPVERIETLEAELDTTKEALRALEERLRDKRLLGKDERFISGGS